MNVVFKEDNSRVCSFTGYRPSKLPFCRDKNSQEYRRLYKTLSKEVASLAEKGVRYFQTGMAQGVDLMCGQVVIDLREKYDIHLFCVIPCLGQCKGWDKADIAVYKKLVSSSSGIIQITNEPYHEGCMMKRNRYLVDSAHYLVAVYDGRKGGTAYTVNYAKKQGNTVIIINPADCSRVELVHRYNKGVLYV